METKSDSGYVFVKPELSLEECRKIMCSDGEHYTDEELIELRDFILHWLEIDYAHYQIMQHRKQPDTKIEELKPTDTNLNNNAA